MKYLYLLLILVGLPLYLWRYGGALGEQFDVGYYQDRFDHSQYCQPECEFRGNIDDPELYTLAGYRYVQGDDPSSINEEIQPLTKYVFGISTHLLGNALPAQALYGVGVLVLLYVLSLRLLSPIMALIPPVLLAIDPLFLDQLARPFVDLSLTFWLLLFILFLVRGDYSRDWVWGGAVLGALALSKSFSYGVVVALIGFIYVLIYARRETINLALKLGVVAVVTYLLGYTMFFVSGRSIVDFAMLHYDILRLYRGYVPEYPKGEIFRLILSGQWRIWWGDKGTIPSPFYSLAWPASLIASIWVGVSKLRANRGVAVHLLVITVLLLFIASRLMFPRYLLPVLPSMYLMLVYGVSRVKFV